MRSDHCPADACALSRTRSGPPQDVAATSRDPFFAHIFCFSFFAISLLFPLSFASLPLFFSFGPLPHHRQPGIGSDYVSLSALVWMKRVRLQASFAFLFFSNALIFSSLLLSLERLSVPPLSLLLSLSHSLMSPSALPSRIEPCTIHPHLSVSLFLSHVSRRLSFLCCCHILPFPFFLFSHTQPFSSQKHRPRFFQPLSSASLSLTQRDSPKCPSIPFLLQKLTHAVLLQLLAFCASATLAQVLSSRPETGDIVCATEEGEENLYPELNPVSLSSLVFLPCRARRHRSSPFRPTPSALSRNASALGRSFCAGAVHLPRARFNSDSPSPLPKDVRKWRHLCGRPLHPGRGQRLGAVDRHRLSLRMHARSVLFVPAPSSRARKTPLTSFLTLLAGVASPPTRQGRAPLHASRRHLRGRVPLSPWLLRGLSKMCMPRRLDGTAVYYRCGRSSGRQRPLARSPALLFCLLSPSPSPQPSPRAVPHLSPTARPQLSASLAATQSAAAATTPRASATARSEPRSRPPGPRIQCFSTASPSLEALLHPQCRLQEADNLHTGPLCNDCVDGYYIDDDTLACRGKTCHWPGLVLTVHARWRTRPNPGLFCINRKSYAGLLRPL